MKNIDNVTKTNLFRENSLSRMILFTQMACHIKLSIFTRAEAPN